uniref:Ig-like domain-containing protein n=1 Tax=Periophthalmus magnuspinnatus TaxID=409849 RepID=A0A3B4B6H9_9GOBI
LKTTEIMYSSKNIVHTLRYFHTSSQVPNFPEFVSVGYLDDLQITHFDSVTRKYVPKQEWMKKITEEDPQFWERNRQLALGNEQVGKSQIKTVKRRLNVTEGVHFVQFMTGCDWDDETGDITGYYQHAFDGEDFISLDFDTETFVAPKDEAFITKLKWERMGEAARQKNYITGDCVKYLKKHVRNGGSALKRTELPLVSMLQKSSSAPVTCHATGFYPSRARLFWTKDGEELLEDVDPGEILPNEDETFQTSVSLDPSSVPSKDWDRYHCVFQLSGDKNKFYLCETCTIFLWFMCLLFILFLLCPAPPLSPLLSVSSASFPPLPPVPPLTLLHPVRPKTLMCPGYPDFVF